MLSKCSLRLKLSDFINSDIEEEVISKINKTNYDLNIVILLYLWYDEGEIDSKTLKDFLMRWENVLQFKTVIKQSSKMKPNEFIFWDIKPENVESNDWSRFTCSYYDKKNILKGLDKFYEYTKFITTETKPVKKQKRNDYED
jgi:hypothetical protein|tara:strand:+ start:191 stop:616 length:426 start_codon:yes stop_codon:yes gene_type:complete